jgi:ABC-2 type transport system permease protein
MTAFRAALWAEALKARRSLVPWLAGLGFCLAPLAGGLFMWILKDPERARSMGIISVKAQIAAGVADWPTMFGFLAQAVAR